MFDESDRDDADRIRRDADDDREDQARDRPPADSGCPTRLAKIVSGGAPGTFATVKPLAVTGPEEDAAEGTTAQVGDEYFALNIGTDTPAIDAQVVTTWCPYRWVFQHD